MVGLAGAAAGHRRLEGQGVIPDLPIAAWEVIDAQGHSSLHHEKVRADHYATQHLRNAVVESLHRGSDGRAFLELVRETLGDAP
jgi:hypothetical protein